MKNYFNRPRLVLKLAVVSILMIFGLCHGFRLATKILDYQISPDGLVTNLIVFNVGVEIGLLVALSFILIAMGFWRRLMVTTAVSGVTGPTIQSW